MASVPEEIPEDLEGQAGYWKDHWNTEAGAHEPEHFMAQAKAHNLLEGLLSN